MRLYSVIPLFFVFTSNSVQAQTTYCFGSLCQQTLSTPEEQMKSAAQPLGDKLTYDYTLGGEFYDVRYYKVPDASSFGTGTEIHNDLPDYSKSGSSACYKNLSINSGSWEFIEWDATSKGTISGKYEQNVSVSVTYGLYEPFTDTCAMKNFTYGHVFRKYQHYECEGGYNIDYGGSGEGDIPVCKSQLTGFLQEYECHAPFTFEQSSRECVKYCPPSASLLDLQLGLCKAPPGEKDPKICAATVGNPIQTGTGEKVQPQAPDYSGSGLFPLRFARNYKSLRAPEAAKPPVNVAGEGSSWTRYVQGKGYSGASVSNWLYEPSQGVIPPVGYKQWMHSYQLSLVPYPDESKLVLLRPDGEKRYLLHL
ncbi:DUF6531 domain-containing protein [Thalassomonas haliotis]|uniref:DUF6531 domain-containing protein n=1 Tax=Thalassomonas haliotis TaxID=485448 RepID=A0ABY7VL58_9GAMM|nr:DUF6531 domain-containing protein [Thalassomonas haliotis]WDE13735.1 hypothetical protein H3N35_10025 [Thalassomonas haliotis]